jgi:hypothetical protein
MFYGEQKIEGEQKSALKQKFDFVGRKDEP